MSMKYIREHYDVPAKRGGKVKYTGDIDCPHVGVIIGSRGAYLRIRFPEWKHTGTFHPTWEIEYLEPATEEVTA